jgi:hypothetical protein
MSEKIDYTKMDGGQMLAALGDDGHKWAEAFCQHAKKIGYGDIDHAWMTGWFANAIESSHDLRQRRTLRRPAAAEESKDRAQSAAPQS